MDTDGDGLKDGDELFKYRTDPTKYDTDGDGLSDGDEILKYHTDPLKADTDGDGLSDGDEVLKYHTNPLKIDTDGDGLSDYDEIFTYKTDPNNPDTDGDGLTDGEEVMKYKTDPLRADTDRGGVPDGAEVKAGTNPLDPSDDKGGAPIKLEKGKAVILEGVNFASGSATLTPGSEDVLERALRALQANPGVIVEIAGYTDDVGSLVQNERLSLRRAEAVKTWLNRKGVATWRMTTVGKGPREPIAPNDTPAQRAKNRRIEFHVK
jgi:outer membrane protein OmpA-like peptidoglycan-associated protein